MSLIRASLVLGGLLIATFLPFALGSTTFLSSARDVAAITPQGAYPPGDRPVVLRQPDAGAAAWQSEPALALEHHVLLDEHALMLWNPYVAFGAPLAAAMQQQPFFPLTTLAALHPSPHVYNWFILTRLFIAGAGAFLFLSCFLPIAPSLLGAVATMLTGYYVIFLDMPHLSVEVWLPALLYAIEVCLRSRSRWAFLAPAAVVFLLVVGGMPESTLLALTLGAAYALFRLSSVRPLFAQTARLATALVLGVALSAFLLVPFAEYAVHSFNTHQPSSNVGLEYDTDLSTAATYIAPLVFGPTRNNIFQQFDGYSGLRGYFGVAVFFLALVALIEALRRRDRDADRVVLFFAAAAVLLVAKRYGLEPLNELGRLPLYRLVIFPKYDEVLLGLSMAVLAAFGAAALGRPQTRLSSYLAAFAVALAAITAVYLGTKGELAGAVHPEYYVNSLGGVLLFALAIFAVALNARRFARAGAWAAVAVVALELTTTYIVPLYYKVNLEPPAVANPYAGAPFIGFLRTVAPPGEARIFARDRYLYPDWSEAFSLAGITDLDALYVDRYLRFVDRFAATSPIGEGDLFDRFTGERFAFTPATLRLLRLSSVRYVVAHPDPLVPVGASIPAGGAKLRAVYDGEVNVFQLDGALPRASLFSSVTAVSSDARALETIAQPAFPFDRTAVVVGPGLDDAQRARVEALTNAAPAGQASIVDYRSQRVEIAARPSKPALLVLNDTAYPGWVAEIDGRRAPILTTDYLFRGVLLDAGSHDVVFTYAPRSFQIGLFVSGIAALAALGLPFAFRTRRAA